MKRAVLAVAVAVGLVTGIASPTSAIGLTQVTLSCDDGTTSTMVVDSDTLTGLTLAVQGMIDYPAGLNCAIAQVPLIVRIGGIALASPGTNPFLVGGGRWLVPCSSLPGGGGTTTGGTTTGGTTTGGTTGGTSGGTSGGAPIQQSGSTDSFWVNIALNVHQRDDGTPYGTLNETIPANQSCPNFGPVGESHFGSTPTCILIDGSTAFVTSHVTQTSGQVGFPADNAGFVTFGNYLHFGFQDNGNPSQGIDMLDGPPATPTGDPDQTCTAATNPAPIFPLQNGNISIRNS